MHNETKILLGTVVDKIVIILSVRINCFPAEYIVLVDRSWAINWFSLFEMEIYFLWELDQA